MRKWLILGHGWGKHKMSLEHLVVPESKEVLKQQQKNKQTAKKWNHFNRTGPEIKCLQGDQLKKLPVVKAEAI